MPFVPYGAQMLDEQIRQVYHPIQTVDAVLIELLQSPVYADADGFVRMAQFGTLFSLKTGKKLNDVVAESLGVSAPVMPGVATRYLRLNPLYEVVGEREFQAVRLRPVKCKREQQEQSLGDASKAKDTFVREHFKVIATVDDQIAAILRDFGDSSGFVSAVDLGAMFTARHRVRLNEAIAQGLGIPVMPGLVSRYLCLNNRFESRGEKETIAFRERGVIPETATEKELPFKSAYVDKDTLVKQRYHACSDVDERILACLRDSYDVDEGGYVLMVHLGGAFRARYGISLNECIAQVLNIPSFLGLAARYVRLNNIFEIKPGSDGTSLALRPSNNAVSLSSSQIVSSDHPVKQTRWGNVVRWFKSLRAQNTKEKSKPTSSVSSPRPVDDFVSGVTRNEGEIPEWLESFAFLKWNALLQCLAEEAQAEKWGPQREILKNKIKYTFLWLAKRFLEAPTASEKAKFLYLLPHADYAIMHTGLLSRRNEDIYLIFQRNRIEGKQPWFANEASIATRNGLNGRLIESIGGTLPECPVFLSSKKSPQFITDAEINMPVEYGLAHLNRLPESVLRNFCQDNQKALDVLPGFLTNDPTAVMAFNMAFRGSPECVSAFTVSLRNALNETRRRIRYDYNTLVPIYYPSADSVNLMAPIVFSPGHGLTADAALVLTYDSDSNAYVGRTFLTHRMAYSDARLVARPTADWLIRPTI